MTTSSSGRKTPVDHGVQIRFINDLHDGRSGAVGAARSSNKNSLSHTSTSSKYGVAVRVQGIAGQPYVVLKQGEKGDSYGVQLRSQPRDYNYPPPYNSLPRRRDEGQWPGMEAREGNGLRRAQSHGSLLLDREMDQEYEGQLRRPPGDGRSGSYGNLDAGVGGQGERVESRPTYTNRAGRSDWRGSHPAGLNGSVERGRTSCSPLYEEAAHSVDSNSLAPVNRLISKFDRSAGGVGCFPRGPAGVRERLKAEDRNRSRSMDTLDNVSEPCISPSLSSPNHYASPPSSTTSSHSSLGRNSGSLAKVSASATPYSPSAARTVAMDTEQQATPDLLRDQDQVSELISEEDKMKQMLFSIMRDGNNESVSSTKHKVNLIFEKVQGLKSSGDGSSEAWQREKAEMERRMSELESLLQEERRISQMDRPDKSLKAELDKSLDENFHLQEQLGRKKSELHQTHTELTHLRMDREAAESQARDLEDQLAALQEELRRELESRGQTDVLQAELMSARAELAEAVVLRQRQDDILRQRERELTALKGALKDEVATHDREVEALREQYSKDMERLRSNMEQVSQSQQGIEAERQKVNATVRTLQQQVEDSRDESAHWREQFQSCRDELRATKQELLQVRLEKEEFEEQLKELQEKLVVMKKQMPDPALANALTQDLEKCRSELKQAQQELEKHRVDCDKKRMEILSLKKGTQEREAEQKYEMDRLRGQSRKDKDELVKAIEKAKQLPDPSVVQELEKQLVEAATQTKSLQDALNRTEQELQTKSRQLSSVQVELHTCREAEKELLANSTRLKDKLSRLEAQLQASVSQSSEAEQTLEEEKRSLRSQLEESRRKASRLGQEIEELGRRLEERERERETLRKENSELEEHRRQLERALEKISKELEQVTLESQRSVQVLQELLEEQRERVRKELQDTQRQSKERLVELERSQVNGKSLQEEVSRLKKELMAACEERDNVQLDKELLTNRVKHLEADMETQKSTHTDRSREVRGLEDKLKRLEMELDEEKNSVELMTDRISRSRDQMDQLRSELMQERSAKQDLELDKNALERQLKELKSRITEMEGQNRSSTGVSQLESKVQELEERLHSEEREKNTLLSSQRRTERKLKEMNITLDEERQQHNDQRDQLTLRVKALKRQVDECESEVERLEGLRRKAVRDMEEQVEQKDALQARVTALEGELKRKVQQSHRTVLDSSALSSDDDDDLYDPSSITSILTEGNLQTSSC